MIEIFSSSLGPYENISELRRLVGSWAKEHFREPVMNEATNTLIGFNKDSRRHPVTSMAPGRVADLEEARLLATLAVVEALAQARPAAVLPRKPNDSPDVVRVHILLADVRVDGAAYRLRLLVKEKTGGHYFYDHIVARA